MCRVYQQRLLLHRISKDDTDGDDEDGDDEIWI